MPGIYARERVLGVIRPTAEIIGTYSHTGHVGVLGTKGTVQSGSYPIEIAKFFPEVKVYQQACPLWVPLVEAGEHEGAGADFIVEKNVHQLLTQSPDIDTVLLACTHYPLLTPKILGYLPEGIRLVSQGSIVAESLVDYFIRHPDMESRISQSAAMQFFTTDSAADFEEKASLFFGELVHANHVRL